MNFDVSYIFCHQHISSPISVVNIDITINDFSAEDEVKFNSSIVTKLQIDLDRNDRFLSEGNDQIYLIIDSSTIHSTQNSFPIKFDPSRGQKGHTQALTRLKSYLIVESK